MTWSQETELLVLSWVTFVNLLLIFVLKFKRDSGIGMTRLTILKEKQTSLPTIHQVVAGEILFIMDK